MPRSSRSRSEPEAVASVRAFWSGTLTFGLVSIPVDLVSAVRHDGVSMRMLDADSGEPLGREYYCPDHDEPLEADEIVRGFEVEDGEFVVVEDEELEALAPRKSRDIDLVRFVDGEQIDPSYFKRGYFLLPSGESSKAYHLLVQTMQDTGRVGIATFVMRGHEYLVAILAERGVLRAEVMRFHDELRDVSEAGIGKHKAPPAAKIKKLEQAIAKLSEKKLDPKELSDPSSERLLAVAKKKLSKGKDVIEVSEPANDAAPLDDEDAGGGAQVVDLMELIKQRMGNQRSTPQRAAKKTATRKTTGKKTTKKPRRAATQPRRRSSRRPARSSRSGTRA